MKKSNKSLTNKQIYAKKGRSDLKPLFFGSSMYVKLNFLMLESKKKTKEEFKDLII